ncbi:N-acetylmuramoyl-L-alanine amidase [Actinoplanes nipponensis]|uniref:N-acetylmuramoyl-L-alanine amidase n=1 Tax=Actinoplanes nipponensis TaxID=135950 RepID=UPI0019417F15|nr:N-acetylmuramoyl-L-alanine amidase [Actinoplanes nipponensis]
MPSELLDLVTAILDDDPASRVMNQQAGWNPANHFGQVYGDVRAIVPHHTAGWPSRAKATGFVNRYTLIRYGESAAGQVVPCGNCGPHPQPVGVAGCECKWGIGPQYYISSDGTIARLISNLHDEARITFHAGYTNGWALGVETGSLFRTSAPPGNGWVRVAQAPAGDDVPGANLFVRDLRDAPREVIAGWWTTAAYAGPAREAPGAGTMLFSEAQYRSWAVLARFLAEQFSVPRNFPLFPHARRAQNVTTAATYRRIVLADPGYAAIVADLPAGWGMTTALFETNPATLQTRYAARAGGGQNQAWNRLFQTYRGFHGHVFSGDTGGRDHDCPGPVFDWHRFAREVWDWWWYPFDVDDLPFPMPGTTTATPARGYRAPDGSTPLLEHYFDDDNHTPGAQILDSRHQARARLGVHGPSSSPSSWRLDANSPVYALANGELVAARFARPSGPVSMSFVLVRHRVFHRQQGHPAPADVGRLDYDRPPDTVYTLYLHLGHPAGLNLTAVDTANPDWLNRVHLRKRECDLGMTFHGHSTHHGIPDAAWNQPLPGNATRPTLADGWRIDQTALTAFLTTLQAGGVAIAPTVDQGTPVQVILGDFLGTGGALGPAPTEIGVRVEVFSPSFQAPGFVLTGGGVSWDAVPSSFAGSPVQRYPSEWSRVPAGAEAAALTAAGVDLTLVTWWPEVARAMTLDPRVAAADRLPLDGRVFHYRAFDFMAWLNDLTWRNEWPKYRQVDASGNPLPAPAEPRSRRV